MGEFLIWVVVITGAALYICWDLWGRGRAAQARGFEPLHGGSTPSAPSILGLTTHERYVAKEQECEYWMRRAQRLAGLLDAEKEKHRYCPGAH